MGGIIHVVQLQFKPEVDNEKIDEVRLAWIPTSTCAEFANLNQLLTQLKALKDKCTIPGTQKPYIQSITAGVDNSIEGLQVRALIISFLYHCSRCEQWYTSADRVRLRRMVTHT